MKLSSKLVLSAVALASAAFAQSSFAEEGMAYNVGLISQYRYRGLAQTKGGPALQGGADYDAGNGFYLGTWASTIKWIKEVGSDPANNVSTKGPLELDLYGGYKFEAAGAAFDVGYLRYQYVNNTLGDVPGYKNANTNELYGAVTYDVFTAKYSYAFSPLFGAYNTATQNDSKGSGYLDLSATFDLGDGYSLVPHVGRQKLNHMASGYSYTDYALTLNKDLGDGLSASAAAITTNATNNPLFVSNGYNTAKSTLVVGVKYTF